MKLAHLTGDVKAWAKRLVDDLNRSALTIADLPAFDDDAAADAANLHGGYRAADGSVRWRA